MWIFKTEIKVTECKSCGKPIIWTITTNGKRAPLIAAFTTLERKTFKLDSGVEVTIVQVPDRDSHFADCPQAQQFRKRRKP